MTRGAASGPGGSIVLPRDTTAIAAARRWLSSVLGDSAGTAHCEDAVLVISELVTNALRHGAGRIEARVVVDAACVRLSVTDHGARLPQLRRVEPTGDGGLGLQIVDRLATTWGVATNGDGKTVWAELGD